MNTLKTYTIDTIHHGAYSELALCAYNKGYDLMVDEQYNITLEARENVEFMPVISVGKEEKNGKVFYNPNISFPDLSFKDMTYTDSFAYWLHKWDEIGDLITNIYEFVYNPEMWTNA